ncbi:MAG: hypothetical protein OJI67_19990 [Prosthecobacter sp.]|nr:hypothetical protein [Prosthecobacter sp.]
MNIKLLSLAGAALCGVSLSSCMTYDPYAYDAGPVPVGSVGYVESYPAYRGYGYSPAYSSLSFFGLGGYGYGRHYYDHDHHHHSGSNYYRPTSASRKYASQVARPSSFRGSSSGSSSPLTPSISPPRQLTRPSSSSSSRSSSPSRSYTAPRSAPRSEARPAPSGRSSSSSSARTTTASIDRRRSR